jgi:hypothetical protein
MTTTPTRNTDRRSTSPSHERDTKATALRIEAEADDSRGRYGDVGIDG